MRRAALLLACVGLLGCAGGGDEQVAMGSWNGVKPGGKTRCARGGVEAEAAAELPLVPRLRQRSLRTADV